MIIVYNIPGNTTHWTVGRKYFVYEMENNNWLNYLIVTDNGFPFRFGTNNLTVFLKRKDFIQIQ
jgi:hypothetical protein